MVDASPAGPVPETTVAAALALVDSGPARLIRADRPPAAAGRLLCVDGPAGSGKTTLAAAVAHHRPGTVVVHLDDLLAGWDGGLPRVASDLVADVLAPLAAGRPAGYRRYDWHVGRPAERVPVPPAPLLVVEGVGAGSRVTAPYRTTLVWVEAAREVRLARGLARDGDTFAPHWESWARREHAHFTLEGTRARADLLVDTRPAAGHDDLPDSVH